jgi:hypothetical protein
MLKHLRRIAVAAVVLVSVLPLAPVPASAVTNLPIPSQLGRWWPGNGNYGTGTMPIKNSSGQQVGTYELTAIYYRTTPTSAYSFEITVCAHDTSANGRGVVARVLLKYGANLSKEVVKRRDGSGCSTTLWPTNSTPVYAVDVDHGETWGSTEYQYTGNYDRYTVIGNINVQYPSFQQCDSQPAVCGT